MRCLALAHAMRSRGAACRFACRPLAGHMGDRMTDAGYEVDWLVDDEPSALARCDWLVVDHYGLDAGWEALARKRASHVLAIDDLGREHDCDVLLDQNWHGPAGKARYAGRVPPNCVMLLGPEYALLQPQFAVAAASAAPRDGTVRRLMVFLGGSDVGNETRKVLEALDCAELAGVIVDVVLGANHPDPVGVERFAAARPHTLIHRDLPSLAGLMAQADLMVGAGGSTTWERLALGLPSVVIAVADNQLESSRALHAAGYIEFLGAAPQVAVRDIRRAVLRLARNAETNVALGQRGRELVRPDGAARVAALMMAHGHDSARY